ncbi:Hypothetical protein, putative [Bodo saltans]|uniref:Uncharacterized protein n=1 Tax=Bodo saltans TaxID=75058 RepID=A0A0S4JHI7_BODSA|nr:Hypothetical protein, putative [Bodo saltans]|eukprot:CUG89633.1 Hypothetical protein, putative [Bodo saltans]
MGSSCSLLDSEQQQQQHPRKKGQQQQQQRRKKSSTAASSSTTNNNNNISTSVSSPAHRNRSFLKRDFTLEKSGRRDPSTANVTSGIESQQQQAPNPLDANSVRIAAAAAGSSSQAPVKSPQHSQQQQQSLIEAQPRSSTPVEIADTTEYPPTIATIERNDLVMGAASSSPPPPQQQQQQQQQLFMPVESALFSGGDPVGLVADDPSQFVVPSVSTHRFSVSQNSTTTRQTTQRHSVSTVMEEGLHLSDSAPPHYQQHRSSVGSNVVVAAAAAAPLPPPPSMLTGVAGPISSVSPQGAAIVNDFSGIVDPFTCSVSAFDTAGKSGQEFSSLSLGEQRQLQQQQIHYWSAVPDSPHPSSSNGMLSAEALGRPLAVSGMKPLVSITTADVGGGSVVIDELPLFANETVSLPKAPPRLSSTANPPTKDRRDGSPPMQEGQKHRNKQLRPLSAKRTNSNLFSMADRTDSRSNGGGGGNNPTQLQTTIISSKAALLKPSFDPTRSSAETSSRSIILAVFLNPKAEEAISNWIDTCDQGKRMPLSDPQLSHNVA